MKSAKLEKVTADSTNQEGGERLLPSLLCGPAAAASGSPAAIAIGQLVALVDGTVPLVTFDGHASNAAIAARSILDLQAAHIGKEVVLMFQDGDYGKPIVIGVIRDQRAAGVSANAGIDLVVDEQRLVITAQEQLILRCGKASITLTAAGKVIVKGTYVSGDSAGVLRLRGGSIQLN